MNAKTKLQQQELDRLTELVALQLQDINQLKGNVINLDIVIGEWTAPAGKGAGKGVRALKKGTSHNLLLPRSRSRSGTSHHVLYIRILQPPTCCFSLSHQLGGPRATVATAQCRPRGPRTPAATAAITATAAPRAPHP